MKSLPRTFYDRSAVDRFESGSSAIVDVLDTNWFSVDMRPLNAFLFIFRALS